MAHKVFISHAYDHGALCDSIVTRLNKVGFDWIDCSVPRQRRYYENGEQILSDDDMKSLLAPHINNSDVVVVIAKPIIARRQWLRWELDYAKSCGKPILAVWRRRVDTYVSRYARERADRCVDTWNIVSIRRAIEELASVRVAQKLPPAEALAEVNVAPVVEEIIEAPIVPSADSLAPRSELELEPDEIIVGELPQEALVVSPIQRSAAPSARIEDILRQSPTVSSELPKAVVKATQSRRRWWQFWKPRFVGEESRLG